VKQECDVTVILDRSGSMDAIASDVVGGFNSFLARQLREPGECRLTLVQFDEQYEVLYAGVPLADVPKLTVKTYQPRGSTALLDAVGRTIDANGRRFNELQESARPDRVLMVIITDGLENASTDYTREQIFKMISTQQDVYHWSFLFLAANQDAIAEGARLGIGAQQSMDFAPTGSGVREGSLRVSRAVSAFRATGKVTDHSTGKAAKKVH